MTGPGSASEPPPILSETANIRNLLRAISKELAIEPCQGKAYDDRRMAVICMTPRSGSSYLGSVLKANGIAETQEHFRIQGGALERDAGHLQTRTYEAYFRKKVAKLTSAGGLFAVKCDWAQYAPIYVSGLHATYMQDAAFFYLTRSDILGQAISRHIATETNYFHSVNDNVDALDREVPFSYAKILGHLEHLVKMQSDWERFFACEGIAPVRLVYEDIARDPAQVIRRIADVLGVPLENPQTETDYKVVRTKQNDRLRAAFQQEHRRRMRETDWL
jgi:trehalose 2-sulfotransferase